MADIKLVRPQQGERVTVPADPEARLDFDFSAADATLEKIDNDLVLSFEDGGSIVLTDFYTAFTKEHLPDFIIEGQPVSGEAFFAALGDELLPAAGPGAGTNTAGGRFHSYTDADLMSGIDRLGGLDLGLETPRYEDYTLPGGIPTGAVNEVPVFDATLPPTALNLKESGVLSGGNTADPGVLIATGQVTATDAEGNALTFYFIDANGNPVPSVTTPYGVITIDANGTYIYTLNDGNANTMAAGQTHTETFTVGVSDSAGGVAGQTQTVTVNITGTNDIPTLELSTPRFEFAEDGVDKLTGKAEGADVDHGADLTYSFILADGTLSDTISDTYGTLFLDPKSGEYTYTLNNESLQTLSAGDTITQTQTIRVMDENGAWTTQQVTVNIAGTNDAPTVQIEGKYAFTVKEEGVKELGNTPEIGTPGYSSMLVGTDVDAHDTLSYGIQSAPDTVAAESTNQEGWQVLTSQYGLLKIDPVNGRYTYELSQGDGSLTDKLAAGETRFEHYKVIVSDNHGGTVEREITVTIEGTNDKPALTLDEGEEVRHNLTEGAEGDLASITGTFVTTDVDSDGAYQNYTVTGGTNGQTTNNAADREGTDNDQQGSYKTDYGTLTLDPATGKYTFTLDNTSLAVNALHDGEEHTETFTITVTDKHGATSEQEVSVTITGDNDAPILTSGQSTFDLQEKGVQDGGNVPAEAVTTAEGTFTVNDVDNGDTQAVTLTDGNSRPLQGVVTDPVTGVMTAETAYGTLTVTPTSNPDGSISYTYTYTLSDDKTNSMDQGDKAEEHFQIHVTDKSGSTVWQEVNINIDGTNDKPEMEWSAIDVKESGVYADVVHHPDPNTPTEGIAPNPGQGWVNANNHKLVAEGELKEHASDADASATRTYSATIEGATSNSTDPATHLQTVVTNYGTLVLNTLTGHYSFTLNDKTDNLADNLGEGDMAMLEFQVTATDEHGASGTHGLGVTIYGTNDRPTLDVTKDTLKVIEDTTRADSGESQGHDVDAGNTLTYSFGKDADGTPITEIRDDYGTLTINPGTGVYSYKLDSGKDNATVQHMGQGDKVTLDHTITVTDEHGATSTHPIQVEITGSNDAPTITGSDNLMNLTENGIKGGNTAFVGKSEASGHITASDIDAGDSVTGYKAVATGSTVGQVKGTGHLTDGPFAGRDYIEVDTGTLYLNPKTGDYTFVMNNESMDKLAQGESYTRMFNVTAMDEHSGISKPVEIKIRVTGTNDKPELTLHDTTLNVTEDAAFTATGTIAKLVDVDSKDSHTYGITEQDMEHTGQSKAPGMENSMKGEFGTLSIDPSTGKYTYILNSKDPRVQGLDVNDPPLDEVFHIVVKDNNGGFDIKDVTISVHGTDDAPVISSGVGVLSVTESGVNNWGNVANTPILSVSGKIDAADADTGDTAALKYGFMTADGTPATSITTDYGTITIKADGTYTYVLNDGADKVNALKAGEDHTENFTVVVTDPHGNHVEQPVRVHIHGTNDQPTFATDSVFSEDITEDAARHTVSGKVSGTDADHTASGDLSYSLVNANGNNAQMQPGQLHGKYGYLTIDQATGDYTYTLYNDQVQNLGAGEKYVEEFGVRVTDKLGASTNDTITITINGTDDKPVLHSSSADVREDAGVITHPDADATTTFAVKGQVKVDDTDTHDKQLFSFGADANGQPILTVEGTYGSITIDPTTGEYTYTLSADGNRSQDIQKLNDGQSAHEHFEVTVISGNGNSGSGGTATGSITINISGTNDNPEIDTDASLLNLTVGRDPQGDAGTAEGFDPTVSGHVHASDIDDSALKYRFAGVDNEPVQTLTGEYGAITINPTSGKYTYTLNANSQAYKNLHASDAKDEIFTVLVDDGHGGTARQEITVTVNGRDDDGGEGGEGGGEGGETAPPVVIGDPNTVIEDNTLNVTGYFYDGTATSTPNPEDIVRGPHFSFMVDGKQVQTMVGTYGAVTIDPETGEYTYTLNNDSSVVQKLNGDENLAENFAVLVDGKPADTTISITVKGTNDNPQITSALQDKELVTENGTSTVTASGQITAKDIDDAPETLRYSFGNDTDGNAVLEKTLAHGTITIDPKTGEYTYTYTDTEHHNADWNGHESVTVQVTDTHGGTANQTITIGLNGVNTAPTVAGTVALSVTEDSAVTTSGKVQVEDDAEGGFVFKLAGADGAPSTIVASEYGTLVIDPKTGDYSFRLNNTHKDVQALGEGESQDVTFKVLVTDKHGASVEQEITVTVHGENDAPTVSVNSVLGLVTEGATSNVLTGQATGHDTDASATLTYGFGFDASGNPITEATNAYGTFTINATTGIYTFTLNNSDAVKGLAAGQLEHASVTVTVKDEHGAMDNHEVTVDIAGTNSTPTVSPAPVSGIVEDNADKLYEVTGKVEGHDPDTGASLNYSLNANRPVSEAINEYGSLTLAKDGTYTFTLNNDSTAVQSIGQGVTIPVTFPVTVTDEHGASVSTQITVNITGTNDDPTVTTDKDHTYTHTGSEDTTSFTGTVLGADVDTNDAGKLTYAATGVTQSDYGTFIVKADGTYTYTLNEHAQTLGNGQNIHETYTVQVHDDHGGTVSQDITINITGKNDAPVIDATSVTQIELVNAAGVLTATGHLVATDAESNALSYGIAGADSQGIAAGTHGAMTIDATGTYTYTLNEGVTIPEGGVHETFTIQVNDGHGGLTDQAVTVNLLPDPDLQPEPFAMQYDMSIFGDPLFGENENDTVLLVANNNDEPNGITALNAPYGNANDGMGYEDLDSPPLMTNGHAAGHVGSGHVGSGHVGSGHVGSDNVGSDNVGADDGTLPSFEAVVSASDSMDEIIAPAPSTASETNADVEQIAKPVAETSSDQPTELIAGSGVNPADTLIENLAMAEQKYQAENI